MSGDTLTQHIPPHFDQVQAERQEGLNPDELMLSNLSDHISWGHEQDSVESSAGVAQKLADEALLRFTDAPDSLHDALLLTRVPEESVWKFSAKNGPNSVAHYNTGEHMLTMNPEKMKAEVNGVRGIFERAGVPERQADDAKLFTYIFMAGHEMGHAKLNVYSQYMGRAVRASAEESHLIATRMYLSEHSEKGLDDDLDTATVAAEEQFSEGYGLLAASEALVIRGYSDEEIKKVVTEFRGAKIDNLLDQRHKDEAGQKKADERSEAGSVEKHEEWKEWLGYVLPLNPSEVADRILGVDDVYRKVMRSDDRSAFGVFTDAEWKALRTHKGADAEVVEQLQGIDSAFANRLEDMNSREKRGRQIIATAGRAAVSRIVSLVSTVSRRHRRE